MDELRRAADLLVADPPAPAASLEDLTRRNARRRNRRRAFGGAVALVVLIAVSVVAVSRPSTDEASVVTEAKVSSGRLAIATANGVTLIDEHDGVVAEVALGFPPISLSWSPNGRWVAALAEGRAEIVARDGKEHRAVSTLRLESVQWVGPETLLVDSALGVFELEPAGVPSEVGSIDGLRSPDGKRLAWTDDKVGSSIVVGEPDGSNPVRLGQLPGGQLPEASGGVMLRGWSPDARWIIYLAYATTSASLAQDGVPLYAVRVADGFAFRMGVTLDYDDWIQWSPDGETMLFVDGEGRFLTQRKVLRACDLDVLQCTEVETPPEASSFDPAWSPDGSRIAFVQVGAGGVPGEEFHGELVTADPSGANRHTFREDPRGVLHPMWTADGAALLALRIVESDPARVTVERFSSQGGPGRELASFTIPGSMLKGYSAHMTPPMAWSASSP